jgi:Zn-dependent M28 family amino/carboxypeptidase
MKKRVIFALSAGAVIFILVLSSYSYYDSYSSENSLRVKNRSMPKDIIELNLENTVRKLAGDIGSRGYLQKHALDESIDYITTEFKSYGYDTYFQNYAVNGRDYKNIWVEKKGKGIPEKILVIGAHYDTVTGTPGADDNASGVAGLLELARILIHEPVDKTVHFVAFTLEEPPFFRSRSMGSYVYAKGLKAKGADVEGMICLESIGYFHDEPGSQQFPLPFFSFFYPDTGNFITFVSDIRSREFLESAKKYFTKGTELPLESLSTLSIVPGVDLSDHRSFWKFGYKAIMVTDTALYRNPHYHGPDDSPDTLDYARMAEVVMGLRTTISGLAEQF